MTGPDYDHLLWDLADRLCSKMTPDKIKNWLIDAKQYDRLTTLSGDELTAQIETWYVELAKLCGVKAG